MVGASLFLRSRPGTGRHLISVRYEGGLGLLLLALAHLVIFKGTPELRRDLVELLGFDAEPGVRVTQVFACICKRPPATLATHNVRICLRPGSRSRWLVDQLLS